MTSSVKLTYYNGILWRTTKIPGGTSVQPVRRADDGTLIARATIGLRQLG